MNKGNSKGIIFTKLLGILIFLLTEFFDEEGSELYRLFNCIKYYILHTIDLPDRQNFYIVPKAPSNSI